MGMGLGHAAERQIRCALQVKVPEEDEFIDNRRFMACCWGPGEPATVLVMLDQHGQLVDMLHCGQLSGVIRRPPRARFDDALAYNMFNDPNKVAILTLLSLR